MNTVMIVPIAMLKPLLMKLSQKLELSIIFGLVTVNIVLTVLRTVYSVDLDFANFPDRNVVWCFLQVTLSVIVCALPCYRGTLMRTKNGWLKNFSRFGSRDSETGGFWQRYFTSSGERSSESIKKEMVGRTSSGSGSTHPEL
jgi:hypothetical protein